MEKNITYSIPVTEKQLNKGESQIYRHPASKNFLPISFSQYPYLKTLQDVFVRSFDLFKNNDCIGSRRKLPNGNLGHYKFKTYEEVERLCQKLGSAIIDMNLCPITTIENEGEFKFIGVYSKNCEQYFILDICASLYGFTLVPIYDALEPDIISYILQQTGLTTIFCSKDHIGPLLSELTKGNSFSLKTIVCFEELEPNQIKDCQYLGLNLLTISFLIQETEVFAMRVYPNISRDHPWVVLYTSGATGKPKGVTLTHGGFLCELISWFEDPILPLNESDIYFSFLPMAHIFERILQGLILFSGGSIGFYHSDSNNIIEDVKELRPTLFASPPSVFNRFYDELQNQLLKIAESKNELVQTAINTKLDNLHQNAEVVHTLYDAMIFNNLKQYFGGKMKYMISGATHQCPQILDFLKIAIGCPIIEIYGTTETHGACLTTRADDGYSGHVGGPTRCIETKLVDLPEFKFTSQDKDDNGFNSPRGELCFRGPQIFKGYFKDPQKTKEYIDKDDWFHTGDIAQMLSNGSFKIIDRIKNIFKLSIGEYILPEKIENIYKKSIYIDDCFIYGEPTKNYLVGIIVPYQMSLIKLGESLAIKENFEELCSNKKIEEKILEEVTKIAEKEKLLPFELVKKIKLIPQSFSSLNLTRPSLKFKRTDARNLFKDFIDQLYSK